MSHTQLANIEHLEADLWDAADNLRANSKLTAGEYCMPVLGVIFLRHATNRYNEALREIQAVDRLEDHHHRERHAGIDGASREPGQHLIDKQFHDPNRL